MDEVRIPGYDKKTGGYWYRLTREEKQCDRTAFSEFMRLPFWWREAMETRNTRVEHKITMDGSTGVVWAYYDVEIGMILAGGYRCPSQALHHLYHTCWRCGQHG